MARVAPPSAGDTQARHYRDRIAHRLLEWPAVAICLAVLGCHNEPASTGPDAGEVCPAAATRPPVDRFQHRLSAAGPGLGAIPPAPVRSRRLVPLARSRQGRAVAAAAAPAEIE